MKRNLLAKLLILVILAAALVVATINFLPSNEPINDPIGTVDVQIVEDGQYSSKDEVALYLITYHKLPSNYITKTKAKKAGWVQEKGNLWDVCKGCSIGGGPYNNSEGILPEDNYYECDIDYEGGNRNAKRLVYTKWGYVYYTDDHYKSFTLLYGEDE